MEERNELNDIILNKSVKDGSSKKVLLTIATFAIILIIVVIVMNQVGDKKMSELPHAPTASAVVIEEIPQEPDYTEEHVPVVDRSIEHTSELVEEDVEEEIDVIPTNDVAEPHYTKKSTKSVKPATSPKHTKPIKKATKVHKNTPSGKYNPKTKRVDKVKTAAPTKAVSGKYYVQVGSFAKYKPSKRFLQKISDRGYTYTFHAVTRNGKKLNKVLVGPFRTQSAARQALPVIKRNVEHGAFLTKI